MDEFKLIVKALMENGFDAEEADRVAKMIVEVDR